MQLGLTVSNFGNKVGVNIELIRLAEALGFEACFTAEAYGSDAATPLAWIGAQTSKIKLGSAIMQIYGRTPAAAAMTAITIDELSGGRFLFGLGPSGPQVVEGWHGVSYDKPLSHLREYIEIIRRIIKREKPVAFDGDCYQLPYKGPKSTGLGVPLKSILHPRKDMKIYTAGITPNGVRLAAEIADGFFPVWTNPERFDVYTPILQEGFKRAGNGKGYGQFDIIQNVRIVLGDDVASCRDIVRPDLALVVGGMGARGKNFYNDHISRQGYEDAARKIQDLFLDGKHKEAAAAVPDKLIDDVTLVGPREKIADRVKAWKGTPVTMLNLSATTPEELRLMAELLL
jgi:F420-dependent oxidoreductase-like protein